MQDILGGHGRGADAVAGELLITRPVRAEPVDADDHGVVLGVASRPKGKVGLVDDPITLATPARLSTLGT